MRSKQKHKKTNNEPVTNKKSATVSVSKKPLRPLPEEKRLRLERVIAEANGIPSNAKTLSELLDDVRKDPLREVPKGWWLRGNPTSPTEDDIATYLFVKQFEGLTGLARDYIGKVNPEHAIPPTHEDSLYFVMVRFEKVLFQRRILSEIAEAGECATAMQPDFFNLVVAPWNYTPVRVNEEGMIERTEDEFIDAITGIEARRIAKCAAECSNLFVLRRLSQKTCSPRCSVRFRVRVWRENSYPKRRKKAQEKRKVKNETI